MNQNNGDLNRDSDITNSHLERLSQENVASELAKAFQELAKGEKTASALENRLDDIESRIDQLLASVEQNASGQPTSHETPGSAAAMKEEPKR